MHPPTPPVHLYTIKPILLAQLLLHRAGHAGGSRVVALGARAQDDGDPSKLHEGWA